jgi:arsenite methyltransferase
MSILENDIIRQQVRDRYAQVANSSSSCCGSSGCCSPAPQESSKIGYSKAEIDAVPDGANMGLGCGNPQAIALLKPGETVVDLGSGGGFDCFLAARQVGATGKVIGVDMTPDMVSKARANAVKAGHTNVDFRLGEIENLPIADNTVDVIISNCVINLSPDKQRVFNEAHRILRSGGRLAISDVVAIGEMPQALKQDKDALCGCISNAAAVNDLKAMLGNAGFTRVDVTLKPESRDFIKDWAPGSGAEEYVCSATITAYKN